MHSESAATNFFIIARIRQRSSLLLTISIHYPCEKWISIMPLFEFRRFDNTKVGGCRGPRPRPFHCHFSGLIINEQCLVLRMGKTERKAVSCARNAQPLNNRENVLEPLLALLRVAKNIRKVLFTIFCSILEWPLQHYGVDESIAGSPEGAHHYSFEA